MSISTPHFQPRVSIGHDARDLYRAMSALERAVGEAGIDKHLHEMLKLRASQINGCAYCVDMHTRDARRLGVGDRKLFALGAWHESPLFTDRERAVLALTDAATLIADGGVPDDVYSEVAEHFEPAEIAALLYAIAAINSWNRLCVASHSVFEEEWS